MIGPLSFILSLLTNCPSFHAFLVRWMTFDRCGQTRIYAPSPYECMCVMPTDHAWLNNNEYYTQTRARDPHTQTHTRAHIYSSYSGIVFFCSDHLLEQRFDVNIIAVVRKRAQTWKSHFVVVVVLLLGRRKELIGEGLEWMDKYYEARNEILDCRVLIWNARENLLNIFCLQWHLLIKYIIEMENISRDL